MKSQSVKTKRVLPKEQVVSAPPMNVVDLLLQMGSKTRHVLNANVLMSSGSGLVGKPKGKRSNLAQPKVKAKTVPPAIEQKKNKRIHSQTGTEKKQDGGLAAPAVVDADAAPVPAPILKKPKPSPQQVFEEKQAKKQQRAKVQAEHKREVAFYMNLLGYLHAEPKIRQLETTCNSFRHKLLHPLADPVHGPLYWLGMIVQIVGQMMRRRGYEQDCSGTVAPGATESYGTLEDFEKKHSDWFAERFKDLTRTEKSPWPVFKYAVLDELRSKLSSLWKPTENARRDHCGPCWVVFASTPKPRVEDLKNLLQARPKNNHHIMIIVPALGETLPPRFQTAITRQNARQIWPDPCSIQSWKSPRDLKQTMFIETFTELELNTFDFQLNGLVPRYRLLTLEEGKIVRTSKQIAADQQFPALLTNGVVSRYYLLRRGDVVEVTHPCAARGRSYKFRLTIEDPQVQYGSTTLSA